MNAVRKLAKKKPTESVAGRLVKIRMYNVGFGDCFLIRLPTNDGEKRMLVDCGFHSQGKGKFSDVELVKQIKADLKGAAIDVVVGTHRHQDHISGFGETALWEDIAVNEVWLPFTARAGAGDDADGFAAWNSLMRTASDLVTADGKLTSPALAAMGARSDVEREAAAWMLWNARENAPGIENLRRGMKRADGKRAKRRYLPEKGVPEQFTTDTLPGVVVYVLGPPREEELRKKKKKGPASWGVTTAQDPSALDAPPFGPEWRVPADVTASRPFQSKSLELIAKFNDDLAAVAAAVDAFLNGESLVLLVEVGKARLLLPGDAEVGAWTKILDTPEAKELAASATFLKVGHHGSHNATPLSFLREDLAAKTPAMMSTQEGPGRYRNNIPRPELLDTCHARKMPLARSDTGVTGGKSGLFTEDVEKRWIDCVVPC